MTDIVLAAGIRTPFGDFGKSLREIPLTDLAAHAAKASISRSGLKPTDIAAPCFQIVTHCSAAAWSASRRAFQKRFPRST